MNYIRLRKNNLCVESISAQKLVKKYKTPFYCYSLSQLKNNLDKNVMQVFNVRNSVNLKTSYGGTSTKNIKKMIFKLKKEFK